MTKALVVDDEQDIRDLLVDTLVDAGYDVIEARNGGEAFELACQEYPDIILLDVWMPVMDGFEVLKRPRETPTTEAIPVILLMALSAGEGEQVGMELGVTHYITKPFDPGMVEAALKVALREAGTTNDEDVRDYDSPVWQGATSHRKQSDATDQQTVIRTGEMRLDQKLGGGIPLVLSQPNCWQDRDGEA